MGEPGKVWVQRARIRINVNVVRNFVKGASGCGGFEDGVQAGMKERPHRY